MEAGVGRRAEKAEFMDKREIFENLHQLRGILQRMQQQQEKASLLLDDAGLSRMEGLITSVDLSADISKASLVLDDTTTVFLSQVVAVNGQFRSDYTEC